MVHVYKKSFVRTTKISCTDLARKTKGNMLMFGKPLVKLAALPKERYINFVDADPLEEALSAGSLAALSFAFAVAFESALHPATLEASLEP